MALGELPLSRSTLDRNAALRSDSAALLAAWGDPSTRVLPVRGGRVPLLGTQLVTVAGPTLDTWNAGHGASTALKVYLGLDSQSGTQCFAASAAEPLPSDNQPTGVEVSDAAGPAGSPTFVPEGTEWVSLRDVATRLSAADAGLAVASIAMFNWHGTMNYCHHCAAPTEATLGGWVRRCTREGRELFPRTDSAVIMSVVDAQGRLLLAQNAAAPDPQRVSVLAGFVEPGEPLEAAVRREVLEEIGLAVDDVTYLGSQPWPFPMSLMVGFTARYGGDGKAEELVLQDDEIAWAEWFSKEELVRAIEENRVWLPSKSSIARGIINHWYGDDSLTSPVDH
ncbi:NAD(+) diphosphatase [Micrococcales bacterium 31B]|nr:NAD(+) diphosphatase [Micrococcales bacterium 31B]